MNKILKSVLVIALALALTVALASCEMLPPELQETINGLIGGSNEPAECTHENVEWVVDTEANCKYEGLQHSVCTACFATVEENVKIEKSTEHTLGDWEIDYDATCLKTGSRFRKCSVCKSKAVVEEIPVSDNHKYSFGACTVCSADQPVSEGLAYQSNGNGTCSITGIGSCTDTSLVIGETSPAGDTVIAIADLAFANQSIKTVIIPDSVTKAGADSFKNCSLTKARVPAAVVPSVNCSTLAELHVTGSGKIADNAMQGVKSLRALVMYEGVTAVGKNAFNSTSLKSITMPKSLTLIGDSAFANNSALNKLVIGEGVIEIGKNAFQNNDFLYDVYISASVKKIGTGAFYQSPRINNAVFAVTEGWKRSTTPVNATELADASLAAKMLRTETAWERK